jgi:hypothetical protein
LSFPIRVCNPSGDVLPAKSLVSSEAVRTTL